MPNSITIVSFNNEPFVRSLTARAEGDANTHQIRWIYPNFATAQTSAFNAFATGTTGFALSARTLIFSFTSTTYDYKTTAYTLCTLPLTCINLTTPSTVTCSVSFDTFPNIDLTLNINYENTNSSSYFYRLTSTNPLTASPNLAPYFINLASTLYDLASSLSGDTYNTWYSLNRSTTRLTDLTALTGFNRVPTTRLSSVQGFLSATTAPGSLSAFWTPHILERSLSAIFVPYFLSGDFIGFPRGYFFSKTQFDVLTSDNIQSSPGMEFYGEGHTETIILSAYNTDPRATRYVWRLNNSTTQYPLFSALSAQPLSSVFIVLTSQPGNYPTIPVSLHLTNSLFLSTDPYYYYDDTTGQIIPYPYYISTTDSNGNEIVPRNKFKESIKIKPYDPVEFLFEPGITPIIYPPLNGSLLNYTAVLKNSLLGPGSLSACWGKYGLLWSWQYFTSANSDTVYSTISWGAISACNLNLPGLPIFDKTWGNDPALSADLFATSPVACSALNLTWVLSTNLGDRPPITVPPEVENTFDFSFALDLEGNGGKLLPGGITGFYTSKTDITNIILSAYHTVQCQISTTFTSRAAQAGYSNDWQPVNTVFSPKYESIAIAPPEAIIYTPNRFVLTGSEVKFENLFERTNLLSAVIIDFDDGKTFNLFDSNVENNFSIVYDRVGSKTLSIKTYTNYDPTPTTTVFPNIIKVFSEYDEVFPQKYRSIQTPLLLPWSNKPQIGSNEWITEDNINNWFKKLYENLEYLENRGQIYPSTYSDYFGYLGVSPTTVGELTSCGIWTWSDLDCFNTSLPDTITWRDVLSAETLFDTNGKYVNQGCATWGTYICSPSLTNPTCYGKYNVEWTWYDRKRGSSLLPITWKQTKAGNEYQKLWRFEPSSEEFFVACDEGLWHVNIPKLDTFYNPIANQNIQLRCIYYGIASRNNILYIAQKTQLNVYNSNYEATFLNFEDTVDGVVSFSNIKNVCLDSVGKVYILDELLSLVTIYEYDPTVSSRAFKLFTSWGGYGTAASNTKFSNPNDLHIDQLDNVWVTDTGNKCVKHYSNTGSWIKTIIDDTLKAETPLSTAVDSQRNVHILTQQTIRVYSYAGEFLFSYSYKNDTSAEPRKINTSYNREVIYLALDTQVLKYFRNGVFYAYIVKDREDVSNITGLYQDEFRNLLITTNDKVLKYPDVMTLVRLKGNLPNNYWKLEDILIHKEEYVQNWVYTKSLQRIWDNIEIFRNTIFYDNSFCKGYIPPIHGKEKLTIGQNEIVTSTVINRALGYLWDNFATLLNYFDPSCEEPF